MKSFRRKMLSFIGCIASAFLIASFAYGGAGRGYSSEDVPMPYLISPTGETVDLTGKDELEFKWSQHEMTRGFRRFYDFRLYKGSEMMDDALIFKEEIPPDQYQKSLPSDMFENGKTYTWGLRQVYDEGRKSRRAYNTFKVIK